MSYQYIHGIKQNTDFSLALPKLIQLLEMAIISMKSMFNFQSYDCHLLMYKSNGPFKGIETENASLVIRRTDYALVSI